MNARYALSDVGRRHLLRDDGSWQSITLIPFAAPQDVAHVLLFESWSEAAMIAIGQIARGCHCRPFDLFDLPL